LRKSLGERLETTRIGGSEGPTTDSHVLFRNMTGSGCG
jgi:hypothetical protein